MGMLQHIKLRSSLKRLLYIPIFWSLPLLVGAQLPEIRFENISEEYGMPYGRIDDIMEDHNGFLWFASQEGVFKFDGYEFKAFRHNILDSTTLSHPYARCVYEDKRNNIWIGTTYGINLLNPASQEFERFLPFPEFGTQSKTVNIVRQVLEDQEGILWVATNRGLLQFNRDTRKFINLNRIANQSLFTIWKIYEAKDGIIWGGTSNGLVKVNRDGDLEVIPLKDSESNNLIVHEITETDNGNLILGTTRGIKIWNSLSQKFIELPIIGQTEGIRITAIIKDYNKGYWAGTWSDGLIYFDLEINEFQQFIQAEDQSSSLDDNNVRSLKQDRFQNLWIGGMNGISKTKLIESGLFLHKNSTKDRDYANQITKILKDREGNIWTDTGEGLYLIKPGSTHGSPVTIHSEVLPGYTLESMLEDSQGNLWLCVNGNSVFRKEIGTNKFKFIDLDPSLAQTSIYKIEEDIDDENLLWFGSSNGIIRFNKTTFETTTFRPKDQISEIANNRISVFSHGPDNKIWLYYTYYNSLGCFDKKSQSFEIYKPAGDQKRALEGDVRDIEVSSTGIVWLATLYGLTYFDTKTKEFRIYTKHEGLPENELATVLEDQEGRIWVCGFQFMSYFNPESGYFTNHLFTREIKKFINRSKYLSRDGKVLFGGINGFYDISPNDLKINDQEPNIVLEDFKVWNESYQLPTSLEETKSIILAHNENNVSFEFAGLHFVNPKANKYRCMLKGYDKDWQELGYDRKVTYTNLSHGDYEFQVLASNSDNVWAKEAMKLELVIKPAFWDTIWFRALLLVTFLFIAYAIIKNRQHQVKLKREKEIAEKTAAFKSRFLANVSHEIRTPMNAIIGLSELILGTKLNKKQEKYINVINKSSNNLVGIINDLLDYSKLESGQFSFSKRPFDLSDVMNDMVTLLKPSSEIKGLNLVSKVSKDVPQNLVGDSLRLYQILINLVGNSIKFTDKGKIWIEFTLIDKKPDQAKIRFEIGDTGIGIEESKLISIFEDFSQADDDTFSKFGGTGLGLSIAKQLVEQQGGTINIKSKPDKGTTIWFDLDFELQNSHQENKGVQTILFPDNHLAILVVEDNEFNRMLAHDFLIKNIPGVKVDLAENGNLGVKMVKQNDYDLILMDVKMPQMNGYEATKEIRILKDKDKKNIPIIGLTANSSVEHMEKCIEAGMNDSVRKPFQKLDLLEKIRKYSKIKLS